MSALKKEGWDLIQKFSVINAKIPSGFRLPD